MARGMIASQSFLRFSDCWASRAPHFPMKKTQAEINTKAAEIWQGMDKNEKCGVRFGMFPASKMQAAEKEGYPGHQLVCALMDCASKDGSMRA
jgi:hypothetical protein